MEKDKVESRTEQKEMSDRPYKDVDARRENANYDLSKIGSAPPYKQIDAAVTAKFGWPWSVEAQKLYSAICDLFDEASRPSVPQQGQAQEYEHLTICNGDRRKPVSRKGGCCCLNVAEDYLLAASRSEEATPQKLLCPSCGSEFINYLKETGHGIKFLAALSEARERERRSWKRS